MECTILDIFPEIQSDVGNNLNLIIGNLANLRTNIRSLEN